LANVLGLRTPYHLKQTWLLRQTTGITTAQPLSATAAAWTPWGHQPGSWGGRHGRSMARAEEASRLLKERRREREETRRGANISFLSPCPSLHHHAGQRRDHMLTTRPHDPHDLPPIAPFPSSLVVRSCNEQFPRRMNQQAVAPRGQCSRDQKPRARRSPASSPTDGDANNPRSLICLCVPPVNSIQRERRHRVASGVTIESRVNEYQ
jgi:hypothetical protein